MQMAEIEVFDPSPHLDVFSRWRKAQGSLLSNLSAIQTITQSFTSRNEVSQLVPRRTTGVAFRATDVNTAKRVSGAH